MLHHILQYLPTLDGLSKIAIFVVMLSVLIVLHEGGHFLVARLNGVHIKDFALGMGPSLFCWKSPRTGTNYRLNLFPIGGYCLMKGEDEKKEPDASGVLVSVSSHDDSYPSKRPLQRLAIIAAGPVVNIISAAVFLMASYSIVGISVPTTTIASVDSGRNADVAGLRAGDTMTKINNVAISSGFGFITRIEKSTGKTLHISYLRGKQEHVATVIPTLDGGVGRIGFTPVMFAVRYSLPQSASTSYHMLVDSTTSTFAVFGELFAKPKATVGQLQGIIGLGSFSGQFQDMGWGVYLQFAALISLSLGIFNLLPFPALDGGRAVFICFELLRGKPIDQKTEAYIHIGGLVAILGLMVVISCHDILSIIASHKTP